MFYRSSDDTTALHVAATYGRVDAIKLLLANGANITLTDEVLWFRFMSGIYSVVSFWAYFVY